MAMIPASNRTPNRLRRHPGSIAVLDGDRRSTGSSAPATEAVPPLSVPRALSSHEIAAASQWAATDALLETLARRATSGRSDLAALLARAHSREAGQVRGRRVVTPGELPHLMALAGLVSARADAPERAADAAALYEYAALAHGLATLGREAENDYVACLLRSGQYEQADLATVTWNADSTSRRQLLADTVNPADRGDDALRPEWLAAFGAVFEGAGVEHPLHADATAAAGTVAFDRLRSPGTSPVAGPLVSVVMSCFRPGPEIVTAIASVLAQSWHDLELIVVDDGSSAGFDAVLAAVAGMDPRVRVIRRPTNDGTYVCRNAGILAARGDFVTMHDSDDWAHPRRIEHQMNALLADPASPANSSHSVRVTDSLSFTQPRGADVRLCEPSLLFRRSLVLGRVGLFDTVRTGADSEFRLRIAAAFGRPSDTVAVGAPLTLQRFRRTSLTGDEIRPKWMHASRIAYASAYRLEHRAIAVGRPVPPRPEPISATGALLGGSGRRATDGHARARTRNTVLDTIVVCDMVEREADTRRLGRLIRLIEHLLERGERVGLAHYWSIGRAPVSPPVYVSELQALVNAGRVAHAGAADAVHVRRVLVPDRAVLAIGDAQPVAWTVEAVEIARVTSRRFRSGPVALSSTAAVERVAERVFGVSPDWVGSVV